MSRLSYTDGRKEAKQLADRDEDTLARDISESGETDPQTAYAGGSQDQETAGKDVTPDDDIDSIEKINEYMIPEQSFDVTLDDWGAVTFVSCEPTSWLVNEEPSFFLVRDDHIVYRFPDNNLKGYSGMFDSIGAVAFRDINDDGKDDIIIIINYITGAGPQGMIPRPTARIFLAEQNEFYIADDIETDVVENIAKKDMTIEAIYHYLKDDN